MSIEKVIPNSMPLPSKGLTGKYWPGNDAANPLFHLANSFQAYVNVFLDTNSIGNLIGMQTLAELAVIPSATARHSSNRQFTDRLLRN